MSGEEDLFKESTVTFSDLPEAKTAIKATAISLPELEISKEEVEEQNKELYKGSEARWDEFGEKYGIEPKIMENILTASTLSWSNLSPIQEKTLPDLLEKDANMIIQSQSGTGKTGCFGVAMLKAVNAELPLPQVICIAPTLELAQQIEGVISAMAKDTVLENQIELLVKGSKAWEDIQKSIIIGTPGKIMDRIKRGKLQLQNVKLFILDEADLLLLDESRKQGPQQQQQQPNFTQGADSYGAAGADQIGEYGATPAGGMRELRPAQTPMSVDVINIKTAVDQALAGIDAPPVRVLLFSATFEAEGEIGKEDKADLDKQKEVFDTFAKKIIPSDDNLITHVIPREKQTLKNMAQYYIVAGAFPLKQDVVKDILVREVKGQTIIFTNRRDMATSLRDYLTNEGFEGIEVLHGEMPPEDRKIVITKFKQQQFKILITTNVSARGLDISTVTDVINFDLPTGKIMNPETGRFEWMIEPATYLHRTGRTARFGKTGTAINILGRPEEKRLIEQLEDYFKIKIKEVPREKVAETGVSE